MNNMKLLIVANSYPHKHEYVAGAFVHSQVKELKKYFERVVVISTTPDITDFLRLWLRHHRRGHFFPKNYTYDNVEVYFTRNIIPLIKTLKRFRGWQAYQSARKILNKIHFKPDIIHAHFIWRSGYIAMKLKEDLNIPYIVTGHGFDVYDLPFRNKFYRKLVTKILVNSEKVLTVSQNNKDIMVNKLKIPQEKTDVLPNGFDPKLFYPMDIIGAKQRLLYQLDTKIICSVGNLLSVKGHIYLIDAALKILKKTENIIFVVIGEGTQRKKLEDSIRQYNLKDHFMLIGTKPHVELSLWINAADVFVMPSLNEGMPTVLFEVLGCGKPFVGTSVGGIPEIILNNKLGILVPPADANAIADAIMKALDIEWDIKYIVNYAKQYTWEKIGKVIIKVYKEVLNLQVI